MVGKDIAAVLGGLLFIGFAAFALVAPSRFEEYCDRCSPFGLSTKLGTGFRRFRRIAMILGFLFLGSLLVLAAFVGHPVS